MNIPELAALGREVVGRFVAIAMCALAASRWDSLLFVDVTIRHSWMFSSIEKLRVDVGLYNAAAGVLLYLIFRSLFVVWLSCALATATVIAFAALSAFKVKIVGVPLLPWDIWLAADAKWLAEISKAPTQAILFALLGSFLAMIVLHRCKIVSIFRAKRGVLIGTGIAVLASFLWTYANISGAVEKWSTGGMRNITWDQRANFHNFGPVYTFWTNVTCVAIPPPSHEERRAAHSVDALIGPRAADGTVVPDVVSILSESFTSLPVQIFRRPFSCLPITAASRLDTPVWGGYTANVEFELLTGYPQGIFPVGSIPYLMYVKQPVEQSLPNEFRASGYETVALHSFTRKFFARPQAFEMLGFDNYLGLEDLPGRAYRGLYVSDRVLLDEALRRLDVVSRKPLFLHVITMMAHLPYGSPGRYPVDPDVSARLPKELELYRASLTQYGSMIFDHERMVCDFLEALKTRKRPTIVLFYGDHYPSFGSLEVYRDIDRYINPESTHSLDLNKDYWKTPLLVFDSRSGFLRLPPEVPAYDLGTFVLLQAGLPVRKIWAMPHKLALANISRSGYDVTNENTQKSNQAEPKDIHPELASLRGHAYQHLLKSK